MAPAPAGDLLASHQLGATVEGGEEVGRARNGGEEGGAGLNPQFSTREHMGKGVELGGVEPATVAPGDVPGGVRGGAASPGLGPPADRLNRPKAARRDRDPSADQLAVGNGRARDGEPAPLGFVGIGGGHEPVGGAARGLRGDVDAADTFRVGGDRPTCLP